MGDTEHLRFCPLDCEPLLEGAAACDFVFERSSSSNQILLHPAMFRLGLFPPLIVVSQTADQHCGLACDRLQMAVEILKASAQLIVFADSMFESLSLGCQLRQPCSAFGSHVGDEALQLQIARYKLVPLSSSDGVFVIAPAKERDDQDNGGP